MEAKVGRCALIVELSGAGHRFYYVRLLAERALARGDRVTILTSDSAWSVENLSIHLGHIKAEIEIMTLADATWHDVERIAGDLDTAITVVPEADGYLMSVARRGGWRGPGRLSLQVMRASPVRGSSVLRWLAAQAIKTVTMLVLRSMKDVEVRVLRSGLWRGRSPWQPSRDPVGLVHGPDDIERIRDDWRLEPGCHWFGVLGAVTANKHLPLVAEALIQIASHSRCGLLIAGRVADDVRPGIPEIQERLEHAGCEVRIVDRVLDDLELDAAVAAIDCLVLAYSHNGPSGTFAKALATGTRVVAAGSPALRRDCAAAEDATEWTPLEVASLAAGLSRAQTSARPRSRHIATEHEFAEALLGE